MVYWSRNRKTHHDLGDLEMVVPMQPAHEVEIVFFDWLRQNILAYVHFPHFLFSDLLIYHAAGFDVKTKQERVVRGCGKCRHFVDQTKGEN